MEVKFKMSNYNDILDSREWEENTIALSWVLELGQRHLLNDEYYKNLKREIEKNDDVNIKTDYLKRVLEIAREMAAMDEVDLYDYIQNIY